MNGKDGENTHIFFDTAVVLWYKILKKWTGSGLWSCFLHKMTGGSTGTVERKVSD